MNNEVNKDTKLDSLIRSMAEQHQPQLPSPGLIWWRSQILKRLEAKERIERPMMVMRLVVAIVGAVLVVGLAVVNWQFLQNMQQSNLVLLVSMAAIVVITIVMTGLRAFRA